MSKPYDPGQEGVEAAQAEVNADISRRKSRREAFKNAEILCDRFKNFVMDSIQEGHHENFNTFEVFLESCFETFSDCELYNEGEI